MSGTRKGLPESPPPRREGLPDDELDEYHPPTPAQDRIFNIVWGIFQITTWCAVAVAVKPRLLEYVGGDTIASWILENDWFRWVAGPPLFLLLALSMCQPISVPRGRARPGGRVPEPHWKPDRTYGSPVGHAVEVAAGAWTVDVRSWQRDHKTVTVASARVRSRTPLSFVVRSRGVESTLLAGIQQRAMGLAVRRLEAKKGAAAKALSFLTEPPVPIGQGSLDRRVVLRTTDPDLARRVLSSPDVAHALRALDLTSRRWTWSFMADERDTAEMRLERPGRSATEETVREVSDVMRAGLAALGAAGVLEEGAAEPDASGSGSEAGRRAPTGSPRGPAGRFPP